MALRAIVFDFDGVIANSEPLHLRAYASVLAREGVTLTEQDYYARYLGFDDVGAFAAIARDRGLSWSPGFVRTLVERKAVDLEALERHASVLFPGAADAIRRAAAIVPIAIASGARGEEIRRVLRREQLESFFAAIVSAEDTPVSKPAPDPYLHAIARLGTSIGGAPLAPADCVAIEDSKWGLESARAAGLHTIAVTNTYGKSALGAADAVISSLEVLDMDAVAALCGDR